MSNKATSTTAPVKCVHTMEARLLDDSTIESKHITTLLKTHYWRVAPVTWHLYRFFGLLVVYVLTILRVQQDWFLFINSRYLRDRCSVTCFSLDNSKKWGHLELGVLQLGRIQGIRLYIGALLILGCLIFPCSVQWIFDSRIFWIESCFNSNSILSPSVR